MIRFGTSASNRSLIVEAARRTCRRIANHGGGIRGRRSNGCAIVRENERIHVDAHEPEATRVGYGGALNEVRPVRIAHIDFDLARRVAPVARRRIAVVAIFANVDGIVAAQAATGRIERTIRIAGQGAAAKPLRLTRLPAQIATITGFARIDLTIAAERTTGRVERAIGIARQRAPGKPLRLTCFSAQVHSVTRFTRFDRPIAAERTPIRIERTIGVARQRSSGKTLRLTRLAREIHPVASFSRLDGPVPTRIAARRIERTR